MELNEIIEEYGIEAIAKRAKVSAENIERISHRDFQMITQVKALGFISILSREFNTDLSSLKQECREYYAIHNKDDDSNSITIVPYASMEEPSKIMSKIFSFIILFSIGYGAWFLFVDNNQNDNVTKKDVNSSSFIESVLNRAQKWIGNTDDVVAIDTNSSSQNTKAWADSENDNGTVVQEGEPNRDDTKIEKNISKTEDQIVLDAKNNQPDNTLDTEAIDDIGIPQTTTDETNKSDPYTIENIMGNGETETETNATDEQKSNEDVLTTAINDSETLATQVPSLSDEENTTKAEIETPVVNSDDTPAVATEEEPIVVKETPKAVSKVVVFKPLKKVWVGYTNLSTMKREAKVTNTNIKFDTDGQSWILVTAHGGVIFTVGGEKKDVSVRGKNYFLIKNGEPTSISHKEFQKLNKSKVW